MIRTTLGASRTRRGLAAASLALVLAVGGQPAAAEPPLDNVAQVTDRASALGGQVERVRDRLDRLRTERGINLSVVFVDSFDGQSGANWAQETYRQSGLSGRDVLLAVAIRDRRYGTWLTRSSGLTDAQNQRVQREYIQPRLAASDWPGAVIAAADGYSDVLGDNAPSSGQVGGAAQSGSSGGGAGWLLLGVPVAGLGAYLLARRRRRSGPQGGGGYPAPNSVPIPTPGASAADAAPAAPEPIEVLQQRAAAALVALDDAIRSSGEELAFAEAQFGAQATERYRQALAEARAHSVEAFRLQHLLSDGEVAEPERRAVLSRVIELAGSADEALDAQQAEFVAMRDLQSKVPQFLTDLDTRVGEVRGQLPVAQQQLKGLQARYPQTALRTVAAHLDQVEQLVDAAAGFVAAGREHLATENRAAAVVAARSAEDALGQATGLLEAIARAGADLAGATEALAAKLASISADVADAHRLEATDTLTQQALTAAHAAIAQGSAARAGGDPLAALAELDRAEHDLDNALLGYREAADQQERIRSELQERFARVHARLASIDQTIATRRGAVGAEARTRISEALRLYQEATGLVDADPQQARALLTRAEELGEDALRRAEADQGSWNLPGPGGMTGMGGRRGLDPVSMILGGILMGGGAHRGGWGGSGGSWGGGGGFGGGGDFGGGGGGGGFGGGGDF